VGTLCPFSPVGSIPIADIREQRFKSPPWSHIANLWTLVGVADSAPHLSRAESRVNRILLGDPPSIDVGPVDRMPEPGDLIEAFSPQPGHCFRMIYSHQTVCVFALSL
jgi:hypothetical protein